MSFESFYCEHNDPNAKEQLGTGTAIGVLPIGNEGAFVVLVLWDDVRNVSPSPHAPQELTWLSLVSDAEDEDEVDPNADIVTDEDGLELETTPDVETEATNVDTQAPTGQA